MHAGLACEVLTGNRLPLARWGRVGEAIFYLGVLTAVKRGSS